MAWRSAWFGAWLLVTGMLALGAAPPAEAACLVNVQSTCGGNCTVNAVFSSCPKGACLVNAVLAHCGDGRAALVNAVASCTSPCRVSVVRCWI